MLDERDKALLDATITFWESVYAGQHEGKGWSYRDEPLCAAYAGGRCAQCPLQRGNVTPQHPCLSAYPRVFALQYRKARKYKSEPVVKVLIEQLRNARSHLERA